MNNFSISVLSHISPYCCEGKIQINKFSESFKMSLNSWSLEEYKQQWDEGLERIKQYKQSCLIANIQEADNTLIDWWLLYKEDNIIYVQNELISDVYLQLFMQRGLFNYQTCYEFIDPRRTTTEDGDKISEWSFTINLP